MSSLQVDTAKLDSLSTYLRDVTSHEIATVADGIHQLNGGDITAFGVLVAQVFGLPTRIAMDVAGDHLNNLHSLVDNVANTVQRCADLYRRSEDENVALSRGLAARTAEAGHHPHGGHQQS